MEIVNQILRTDRHYSWLRINIPLTLDRKEEKTERKKEGIEIVVHDEDGNEIPYEIYGYLKFNLNIVDVAIHLNDV